MKPDFISILLLCIFLIPVAAGAFDSFSRDRIQYSLDRFFESVEFLLSLVSGVYLTNRIFFNNNDAIFKSIHDMIPSAIRNVVEGQGIITYVICVPVIMLAVMILLRLVFAFFEDYLAITLTEKLYRLLNMMAPWVRRFIGALCQVPRAFCMVFIFCLVLNFYNFYFYVPSLSKALNESAVYNLVNSKVINPVLNSNIAKKVPVILNDSFRSYSENTAVLDIDQLAKQLVGGNIKVIEYFNGVTLDEAIKSTPEIDETARTIASGENSSTRKAYALYRWVSQNIKYDNEKAVKVSIDPRSVSSGSIIAFETRKGICFDFSCLYVSMCRAVGLKVRLITGLAYSGVSWGDHAWNQVYSTEENRWINVDTTFGSSGNYFDKRDFNADHAYAEIQGEW